MRAPVLVVALVLPACTSTPAKDPTVAAADPALDDRDLVGVTPGAWTTEGWINGPPLALEDLRGRVVLVRWFMSNECPYCTATAPALNQLHADYASRGLVVVGLYHHHGDDAPAPGEVETYVRRYGFRFPVATDVNWSTLERWWLRGHRRAFTSVSFLLDRQGRIRGVHPGGRYAPGDPAYASMRAAIERLLAE